MSTIPSYKYQIDNIGFTFDFYEARYTYTLFLVEPSGGDVLGVVSFVRSLLFY
ncbi:hypothetical protein I8748_24040 [Nostoc sp. CENA67]|uniref:Uncharacterized protein n=1 Tax=Amazonocrinis nigriterrae CENA67 TaxID=2794033 RepID=A0A8J7HXL7_9NOST|nr:hypothetical protein [Amazonocrinis nigriterrae]MBH8565217.1 hypothetical protein [Amazonocrinis nigriterrae CENA67]